MKKFLPLLVTVAVLLPACCVYNGAKHPAQRLTVPEQIERKTVAMVHWLDVVGTDEDGDPIIGEVDPEQDPKARLLPYCSGVWVSADTFVTAEHCVDDIGKPKEAPVEKLLRMLQGLPEPEWDPTNQPVMYAAFGDVKDESGKKWRSTRNGRVLAVDKDHDLAVVKAEPGVMEDGKLPEHDIATLAREAHVGDEVHVVGHTVGLWWSYTHGWIAQFRPQMPNADEKPVDVIQVSAPVWFGNSGGGCWNLDGELLGISSWLRKAPNVSFFVDYDTVGNFLRHQRVIR